MSGFKMSGFKSLLMCAGLLGSLLGFAHGTAFAQTTNAEIASGVQSPPKSLTQALAQPPPPAAGVGASPAPSGPEQRVALVIGNSNYQSAAPLRQSRQRRAIDGAVFELGGL